MPTQEKILVAMSGGVDSSVTALLLKQEGFDCIGVTMKLYSSDVLSVSDTHTCCSLDDVEDAKSVCRRIGIPHYVFNFSDRFRENVIERFVCAYESGATPNPCIDCNRYLKFDALYRRAEELGCSAVATGHYARISFDEASGRFLLKKALDPSKDQSYVLYSLTQDQLSHTRFPLGELTKDQVRALAGESGFLNADKPDSQDICFVPDGDYAAFIERYRGKSYPDGDFIDRDGKVLGTHKGIIRYTVGQRKGLGVALLKPKYVCKVDPANKTVTLGDNEDLFTSVVHANQVNLISTGSLPVGTRLKARIRYRQKEDWATVTDFDDHSLTVRFDTPQRAVTKGQSIVLYDGDVVLGGGVIA